MHHFFVSPEQIGEKWITIEGNDVNHIKNVLRMECKDQICISNGLDQKEYRCELVSIDSNQIKAKIMWVEEQGMELPSKIYLFQGLPKGDKMELIIQKAVELGVFRIIPVQTKRSVVRLDAKKRQNKCRRWNSIAESAAKQSKRLIIPEVTDPMTFAHAVAYAKDLEVKLMPYEMADGMADTRTMIERIRPGESIAVFIGPEGGFDEEEVDLAIAEGVKTITLGRRILRTETAGMTTLSILMFCLEDKVK